MNLRSQRRLVIFVHEEVSINLNFIITSYG
jgi:hypothetical protein